MSAEQLQSIIESIGEMQVNWSEDTALDVMRDDLEGLYRKFPYDSLVVTLKKPNRLQLNVILI